MKTLAISHSTRFRAANAGLNTRFGMIALPIDAKYTPTLEGAYQYLAAKDLGLGGNADTFATSSGTVRFQSRKQLSHRPSPIAPQYYEKLEQAYQHFIAANRNASPEGSMQPVEFKLEGTSDTLCLQGSRKFPETQFSLSIQYADPQLKAPQPPVFNLNREGGGTAFTLRSIDYPVINRLEQPPMREQKANLEGILAKMIVPEATLAPAVACDPAPAV